MKLAITLPLILAAASADNAVKTQSANEIEVSFRFFVVARDGSALSAPSLTLMPLDHISSHAPHI
jgi:hypothetical protein